MLTLKKKIALKIIFQFLSTIIFMPDLNNLVYKNKILLMMEVMKKVKIYLSITMVSYLLNSVAVFAQGGSLTGKPSENEWKVSLGGGLIIKSNNRENNIYKRHVKELLFTPLPYITASYGRFSLGAQGLSARIVGFRMVNLSANINRGGDKYLGEAMTKRRTALFGGLSAKYFSWAISFSRDLSGYSKGYQAQLSYSQFTKLNDQLVFKSSLNLDWFDDLYANYYFGVRASEATTTRPTHRALNFFQPGISLMPIYSFKENWSLVNIIGFKFQPKELRESPTVNEKKIESTLIVAINYTIN